MNITWIDRGRSNDKLRKEIKALWLYVDRDEYNLNVVNVMLDELRKIADGLRPCEKIALPGEQGEEGW